MALTDAEDAAVAGRVVQFIISNEQLLKEMGKEKGVSIPDIKQIEARNKKFIETVQKVKGLKQEWDIAEDKKTAAKADLHKLVSDYINILQGIVGKTTQRGRELSEIRSKLRGTPRSQTGQ